MPKPEESPETKHKVVFLSEEEAKVPSTVQLGEAEDGPPGLILPNGEINWNCPCLGGMAVGPCGVEFREAFSCFHYSVEEPKGKDCLDKFATMQECMKEYPELYEERKKEGQSEPAAEEKATEESKPTEGDALPDAAAASDTKDAAASDASKDEEVVKEAVAIEATENKENVEAAAVNDVAEKLDAAKIESDDKKEEKESENSISKESES